MPSTISPKAIPFIRTLEGQVLHAYRDSGGVITIGVGFTMRSAAFSRWWLARKGHALRMGDTMTGPECEEVLPLILGEEYVPPVIRKFGTTLKQHQLDQCASTVYNCGAATLNDRWANALAVGDVGSAAQLLRSTRITANGKRIQGLVNRREEEAELLQVADYVVDFGRAPGGAAGEGNVSVSRDDIRLYQSQLAALGYQVGVIDGIHGTKTDAAVRAFQRDQQLLVDGIVGRATRARLADEMAKQRGTNASAGIGIGGAATTGFVDATQADPVNWLMIGLVAGGAALATLAGVTAWRYRYAILGHAERAIPALKRFTSQFKPIS